MQHCMLQLDWKVMVIHSYIRLIQIFPQFYKSLVQPQSNTWRSHHLHSLKIAHCSTLQFSLHTYLQQWFRNGFLLWGEWVCIYLWYMWSLMFTVMYSKSLGLDWPCVQDVLSNAVMWCVLPVYMWVMFPVFVYHVPMCPETSDVLDVCMYVVSMFVTSDALLS